VYYRARANPGPVVNLFQGNVRRPESIPPAMDAGWADRSVAFERRGRYDLSHPDARPWLYGIATHLVSHSRI